MFMLWLSGCLLLASVQQAQEECADEALANYDACGDECESRGQDCYDAAATNAAGDRCDRQWGECLDWCSETADEAMDECYGD